MKIIVIGLGSMGKRRIRLIKKINVDFEIIGIDTRKDRRNDVEKEFEINTFDSLEKMDNIKVYDCAFVCTSPLSHGRLINQLLNYDLHIFTELNLIKEFYLENIELAKNKNKVLFLSSTFLYREEIKYIKKEVLKAPSNLSYTYHVGQYLPDWHPWENINEYFVGNKTTNGCREIFAIEFPWIVDVFGTIENLMISKSKKSSLDIDYMDTYHLIIEHINGNSGVLNVDVVSRKPVRNLEIYGENLYIKWDGTPKGLRSFDLDKKEEFVPKVYSEEAEQLKEYSAFVIENAYRDEICEFFDVVFEKKNSKYGFEEDFEVLEIIDRIEGIIN